MEILKSTKNISISKGQVFIIIAACQYKRPNYLSNKIFYGHIVAQLYFHNPPYFEYWVWNEYFEYFFELIVQDLNKQLWTIEQDVVRGKLLAKSKL